MTHSDDLRYYCSVKIISPIPSSSFSLTLRLIYSPSPLLPTLTFFLLPSFIHSILPPFSHKSLSTSSHFFPIVPHSLSLSFFHLSLSSYFPHSNFPLPLPVLLFPSHSLSLTLPLTPFPPFLTPLSSFSLTAFHHITSFPKS